MMVSFLFHSWIPSAPIDTQQVLHYCKHLWPTLLVGLARLATAALFFKDGTPEGMWVRNLLLELRDFQVMEMFKTSAMTFFRGWFSAAQDRFFNAENTIRVWQFFCFCVPSSHKNKNASVFGTGRKSMKKPKKNCCRVARWSVTRTGFLLIFLGGLKEGWKGMARRGEVGVE